LEYGEDTELREVEGRREEAVVVVLVVIIDEVSLSSSFPE
jgi:hypothetical protein